MKQDLPSDTAILIARSILLSADLAGHSPLLAPGERDLTRHFLGDRAETGWFAAAARHPWTRRLLVAAERLLLRGIFAHYLARKRWIEREAKRALEGHGVRQVVVIGAGFDSLGWRWCREDPGLRCFELDHPATQQSKRAASGAAPGAAEGFHLLPVDLTAELPEAVLAKSPSFDPTRPAVVIVEGVTMYLDPARVSELLASCGRIAGPRGHVIFTFMEKAADGSFGFRSESSWIRRWLRWRKEPFRWGCTRDELDGFLKSPGLQSCTIADHHTLRREILQPRGIGDLPLARGECPVPLCPHPPMIHSTLCNDVHSRLNPVRVSQVQLPQSTIEVAALIRDAASHDRKVSICGGRHAMGGQQFGEATTLLDCSELKWLGEIDEDRGLVEAGAGLMWPELIRRLHEAQGGRSTVWTIRQKQTGADDLTLGGALASNIHGRGLRMKPFIDDIEAFTLVNAAGAVVRCSRQENGELFRLAIGGYGCFGVITSVALRLTPRIKVERTVEVITLDRLLTGMDSRISGGALYGDFQFAIDESSPDFLHRGVLSTYRPVEEDREMEEVRTLGADEWKELIRLAHTDRTRAFETYAKHYIGTDGSLYWSDTHQLAVYLCDYHDDLDCCLGTPAGTEMITELYVPRHALTDFMKAAAEDLRPRGVPVIYGTIRWIQRDDESFLAWAREDYVCVIFNLHVEHDHREPAIAAFRSLIDLALSLGGNYFLTYHRWARPDQVECAYPQFREFLAAKERHDPHHRFQSEWWRHYRNMFVETNPSQAEQRDILLDPHLRCETAIEGAGLARSR